MNAPLRKSIVVRCDVENAFHAFTTHVDMWWPRGHRRSPDATIHIDASVGGQFVERSVDGTEKTLGEVVWCEPPHRIVYTWNPGAHIGPTTVEVRFVADGAHTLVEIEHQEGASGLGALWGERVQLFGRAWGTVLPAFEEFVAQKFSNQQSIK